MIVCSDCQIGVIPFHNQLLTMFVSGIKEQPTLTKTLLDYNTVLFNYCPGCGRDLEREIKIINRMNYTPKERE